MSKRPPYNTVRSDHYQRGALGDPNSYGYDEHGRPSWANTGFAVADDSERVVMWDSAAVAPAELSTRELAVFHAFGIEPNAPDWPDRLAEVPLMKLKRLDNVGPKTIAGLRLLLAPHGLDIGMRALPSYRFAKPHHVAAFRRRAKLLGVDNLTDAQVAGLLDLVLNFDRIGEDER